jgi:hypothetical protein
VRGEGDRETGLGESDASLRTRPPHSSQWAYPRHIRCARAGPRHQSPHTHAPLGGREGDGEAGGEMRRERRHGRPVRGAVPRRARGPAGGRCAPRAAPQSPVSQSRNSPPGRVRPPPPPALPGLAAGRQGCLERRRERSGAGICALGASRTRCSAQATSRYLGENYSLPI